MAEIRKPSKLTGVGSVAGTWTSLNNTVDTSSWRNFTITSTFAALITKLNIAAIDGNATPDMDYDIEIYEDSGKTTYAYVARGITSPVFEDKIPWEWFGSTTIYGKIVNNKAAAMTDVDITISYRR